MTIDSTSVGRAIRRRRREKGWTQSDLADRCGWDQSRISAIEAGKKDIRLGTLGAVAHALGTGADDLMTEAAGTTGPVSAPPEEKKWEN